jgi:negative regulator of flagellin synthesis FlgM
MKIGPLDAKSLPAAQVAERRPVSPVAPGGTEPSAKVDLKASAALRSEGLTEPTFDAAKVERIAQAIRDGSFKVNADVIADKLIANAQELLGRTQR